MPKQSMGRKDVQPALNFFHGSPMLSVKATVLREGAKPPAERASWYPITIRTPIEVCHTILQCLPTHTVAPVVAPPVRAAPVVAPPVLAAPVVAPPVRVAPTPVARTAAAAPAPVTLVAASRAASAQKAASAVAFSKLTGQQQLPQRSGPVGHHAPKPAPVPKFKPQTTAVELLTATYEELEARGGQAAARGSHDVVEDKLEAHQLFFGARHPVESNDTLSRGLSLGGRASAAYFHEAALLGTLDAKPDEGADNDGCCDVYLNTHEPFCLVAVGVQGGGKSHTSACIVEACLLPFHTVDPTTDKYCSVVRLKQPMAGLVLHYDSCDATLCEATGLISPAPVLARLHAAAQNVGQGLALAKNKMVVLVSPSYYLQRQKFYGDYCVVKPLLFRWATLTADHLKRIMALPEGDQQPLYVSSMMNLLRTYQAKGVMPTFDSFVHEVTAMCKLPGQGGALQQRLGLLESLVAESPRNTALRSKSADLLSSVAQGSLVIADMTDPLLNTGEVNGIFQMLVEQFRALPLSCGKLLALDEAHKFMDGTSTDGLSAAIVNVARLMRHDGIRLLVSTQSPRTLAPELLELVTVAVMHRFHSADWFTHLEKKLPLPAAARDAVMALTPGHAVVFASQHSLPRGASLHDSSDSPDGRVFQIHIRPRLTADRGASKVNTTAADPLRRRDTRMQDSSPRSPFSNEHVL